MIQNQHKVSLADIRDLRLARQIHALKQAAYTVEAEQIGCSSFPPLNETLEILQSSNDDFLIVVEGEHILGCISYECAREVITITRLVVSPHHFRRGVANALLQALETRFPAGTLIYASTADLNAPAIKAYEKRGYGTVSKAVTPHGITLRRLCKRAG